MKYSRPIFVWSVGIVTLFCLTLPMIADTQAEDKAAIQSEINTMDKAANDRNAKGYVAFTHPDFVNIDKTGKETTHGEKERLEKFSQLFARTTQVKQQTTITHISFSKQGAIVDKTSNSAMTMAANGQIIEMKGGGTYRDFWVKSAGVWLQKRSRAIAETFTVNGQPVP